MSAKKLSRASPGSAKSRQNAPNLKPKPTGKGTGFGGFDKKTNQPLPDTSRIPWFQPMPKKTGRRQDDSGRRSGPR